MQGRISHGRVIRLGRAMEPNDIPIADKLGEWQRRLALIRLMDLHAQLRQASRRPTCAAAHELQLEMLRERLIYLALLSASESEERLAEVERICLELECEVEKLLVVE